MQEKLSLFKNYWHFLVIIILVVWIVIQADKVAGLKLDNSGYKERIEGLNGQLKQKEIEETNLRKNITDLTTIIKKIQHDYDKLPKDKDIQDSLKNSTPIYDINSSWNELLQPIQSEINNSGN